MKRQLDTCDSDSTTSQPLEFTRLGKCEVCSETEAKYTCPKCEVKTCCLSCSKIHKKELNCDGVRDRTKYVPLNKMTKMDYISDYNFLEECTRFVDIRKHDKIKEITRHNKFLPRELSLLQKAGMERKTTIKFLLDNFKRRSENTTYLDSKSKIIYWRVEWIFTNAGHLDFIDDHCSENEKLSILLDKYVNIENIEVIPLKKCLEIYQSKGISNLKILLKSEGIRNSKNRFYLLDCSKTLRDNLIGKTLVEFPCIHVIYDDSGGYEIIDSDEDVESETKQHMGIFDEIHKKQLQKLNSENAALKREKDAQDNIKQILINKRREDRRKKREELEKAPTNYLFANEKLLDCLTSDSDND